MRLNERYVTTQSLSAGPRRAEISKIDREIDLAEFSMNLALDTGEHLECTKHQLRLSALRAERQRLLDCPIMEVSGWQSLTAQS